MGTYPPSHCVTSSWQFTLHGKPYWKSICASFKRSLEEYGYWPSCKSWPWFLLLLFISSLLLLLALLLSTAVQDESQHTTGTVSSPVRCGPQLRNLHPSSVLVWSFNVTCKVLTGSQIIFNKQNKREASQHPQWLLKRELYSQV